MAKLSRTTVYAVLGAWWLSVAVVAAQETAPVRGFGTDPPAAQPAAPSAEREGPRDRGDRERGGARERGSERGGERGRRGGRRGGRREGEDNARPPRDQVESRATAPAASAPATTTAPAVAGFGTASPAATDASRAEGIRKWATALITQHDKNGNMMLEPTEQGELKGQSRGADLNGDGVITVDELITHVSPKPASAPAAAPATASARSASVVDTRSATSTERLPAKSYRFRSAKDRLPEGLPGWFASKDTNGDGQVSMSEYGRFWTNRLAAEFERLDRNNDGMISPEEAR